MYFGRDYWVTDNICIKQPTIGQIVDFGEMNMQSIIYPFVTNPTACRVKLWDIGIDWNKISDYDLFLISWKMLENEDTSLIFGDTDFTGLQYMKDKNNEIFLYNPNTFVFINKSVYEHIAKYLRTVFNIHPKVEKAKGKITKEWIIEEEREEIKKKQENKYQSSFLLSLISATVNHAGFKYNTRQLEDIKIVEFMDSVKRLQIYEESIAMLHGVYSGMVDISKINQADLNWLKDLYIK